MKYSDIRMAMKVARVIPWAVLLVLLGCQVEPTGKYVPSTARAREKYATPEPGTYLRPMAYMLLKEIKSRMDKPEDFKEPGDMVKEVLASRQKRLIDTIVSHDGREVPVRIYYPTRNSTRGNNPVMLFLHGGGFIIGSVEEYHILVSKLARITNQIIISVEYGLAPEHPFPGGLDDCFAVLCWLQEHASELGADPGRITVTGDSAGGNLATVLTLMCRDRERPQPYRQVLLYPGVSFVDSTYHSMEYFSRGGQYFLLTESFMQRARERYIPPGTDPGHPYLSPLGARLGPELPPALIIAAECDPIRDGARMYAKRLRDEGIEVDYLEYSGMIHGFMSFHMIFPEAIHAMKYIKDYLDKSF
jgi:acetyl esterase